MANAVKSLVSYLCDIMYRSARYDLKGFKRSNIPNALSYKVALERDN